MVKEFKPQTDKCPICDTTWKKTYFGAKVWYDCIPCNKTAEDVVVLKKTSSSGTREYKIGDIEAWEEFLSEIDFDDDDDYGTIFLSMTMEEKADICDKLYEDGIIEDPLEWMDWYYGV